MGNARFRLMLAKVTAHAIAPPAFVTPPTITTAEYRVGVLLVGSPGEIVNAQVVSFEWLMDGEVVPGATASTYMPVDADAGKVPALRVTAANASPGSPVVVTSAPGSALAAAIPQDPILPNAVTARFLPDTKGGWGGHKCGYAGTGYLKLTGAAAAFVRFDDLKELVPVGAFNGPAPAWTPGASYAGVIDEFYDAGMTAPTGRVAALTLAVATEPGFSITWRSGSAANNDNPTTTMVNGYQLKAALNANPGLGYTIEVRDGAVLNPAGEDMRLRTTYTPAQVTARAEAFTGENHVVIRPETPLGATVRCIKLDGQNRHRVDYLRFQYFKGELTSAASLTPASHTGIFGETAGADHIDIWDCDISSTPNSEFGLDQFSGIYTSVTPRRWRVRRNKIHDVAGGVYLHNMSTKFDFGTAWAALPTGQADHHDSADCYHEVSGNEIYRVANDEINITNATGPRVFGNWLYDKVTGVTPWDALSASQKLTQNSPYDTNVQPHGDSLSFGWQNCAFGSVDGPIVWNNYISRGLGRDTMPFYTSPPYPNPDSKGYVPSAAAVYNSSQGIWMALNDPQSTYRGWDGVNGSGTGYPVILKGPQVINCTYNRDMVNGLTMSYAENPIIENNAIMGCKNVPTANYITSAGRISCHNILGTLGRIRRNIGNGSSITVSYAAGGALASFEENIFVSYSATEGPTAYGSVWNDPVDGPALRSPDDWAAHYRAKVGGPADQANVIGAFTTAGAPVQQYAA